MTRQCIWPRASFETRKLSNTCLVRESYSKGITREMCPRACSKFRVWATRRPCNGLLTEVLYHSGKVQNKTARTTSDGALALMLPNHRTTRERKTRHAILPHRYGGRVLASNLSGEN